MKRIVSMILILTILCSMGVTTYAKEDKDKDKMTIKEVKKIDFSKEPSDEDKVNLAHFYLEDSNQVFNSEYGVMLLSEDTKRIKEDMKNKESKKYIKEKDKGEISLSSTSSLGTVGDILVTYSYSSLGYDWGATGHAAIVHTNSSYTIESFPKSSTHQDGVRKYTNDWKTKTKVYGVRVTGASMNDYTNAANYAINQANAQKGYNWNFFNKGTTSKFYCSQLVWRAWINQGFDVDRMNLGIYEPVSPAELVGGSNTYIFYHV